MNIKKMLQKAFVGGQWYVAYRNKNDSKKEYTLLKPQNGWIADPFLYEHGSEHYLFVEYATKDKGSIAYYKFVDQQPVFGGVVIRQNYHLSYPCVFQYQNNIYMIPESADNHSVDLYRALIFPDKWCKVASLLQGIYYDSTIFFANQIAYMITYRVTKTGYDVVLYTLDLDHLSATQISSKRYKTNIGRPAGGIYISNGQVIRPAQDCSQKYGEKVLLYSMGQSEGSIIIDQNLVGEISSDQCIQSFQRLHTYNEDTCFEVVDLFKERISIARPFRLLAKKIIQS